MNREWSGKCSILVHGLHMRNMEDGEKEQMTTFTSPETPLGSSRSWKVWDGVVAQCQVIRESKNDLAVIQELLPTRVWANQTCIQYLHVV